MSWEALGWAKQQKGLGQANKLLLILLAEKADGWACWPSIATLAEEMEVSDRTVQRHLKELEDAHVLRREERKRPNGSRTSDKFVLVNRGDNLSPPPCDTSTEDVAGTSVGVTNCHQGGDMQGVTPRTPVELKNNYPTASGGEQIAWTDTDGAMFLVQAEPVEITARVVVAAWVDKIRENGVEPSKAQVGRVARTAKELLEKNDGTVVLEAAKLAGEAGHAAVDSSMTIAAGKGFVRKPTLRPSSTFVASNGTVVERG